MFYRSFFDDLKLNADFVRKFDKNSWNRADQFHVVFTDQYP